MNDEAVYKTAPATPGLLIILDLISNDGLSYLESFPRLAIYSCPRTSKYSYLEIRKLVEKVLRLDVCL